MNSTNIFRPLPVAALVIFSSCSGSKKNQTADQQKVLVKVESVTTQPVEQLQEFTGTVEANIVNKIAPSLPIRIKQINVEVGDRVHKGQKLVQMDIANLRKSEVQLHNVKLEFDRADELYKVGGISRSEWDAKKAAYDVEKASYDNLVENTTLISPIEGVVTARNYDNGDLYSSLPVLVVEQIAPVKLMINVSESFFTQVKKGMQVKINLDVYGDEEFKGHVNLIYPTIDPATRTFPVEIIIDNRDQRVRPGMYAHVTVGFGRSEHVVVPDRAVIKQAGSGERFVYVYKDGKVSYNKVELGRRLGASYELLSGVDNGDQVVVTGQNRLTNGMEVQIQTGTEE